MFSVLVGNGVQVCGEKTVLDVRVITRNETVTNTLQITLEANCGVLRIHCAFSKMTVYAYIDMSPWIGKCTPVPFFLYRGGVIGIVTWRCGVLVTVAPSICVSE